MTGSARSSGVDDGVEALLEAGEGLLHGLLHGGRDQVIADLLGGEGFGVAVADVDAFTGLAAHELLEKLHEHGSVTAGMARLAVSSRGPGEAWSPPPGRRA